MTNEDKRYLKELAKRGLTFEEIKRRIDCSDSTIKRYIRVFGESK